MGSQAFESFDTEGIDPFQSSSLHSQQSTEPFLSSQEMEVNGKQIEVDNYLLHLELDGALEVRDLLLDVVVVGQQGGELAGLVQSGAQQPGDLLDQRL